MYKYDTVGKKIAEEILEMQHRVIGITGTSCIGKSTLTKIIKVELEKRHSVTVIGVDHYLKEEVQGGSEFWSRTSEYLMPMHFDWERLSDDMERLKNGEQVEKRGYMRGVGWSQRVLLQPADIYILEGLFLDSLEAAKVMHYDQMVVLTTSDEHIYKLRMARDDYYRQNYAGFTRTKEETIKEIECTLKAGKAYQAETKKWNRTELYVQEGFGIEIIETKE